MSELDALVEGVVASAATAPDLPEKLRVVLEESGPFILTDDVARWNDDDAEVSVEVREVSSSWLAFLRDMIPVHESIEPREVPNAGRKSWVSKQRLNNLSDYEGQMLAVVSVATAWGDASLYCTLAPSPRVVHCEVTTA